MGTLTTGGWYSAIQWVFPWNKINANEKQNGLMDLLSNVV